MHAARPGLTFGHVLALVPVLLGLAVAPSAPALAGWLERPAAWLAAADPGCPEEAERCFTLRLFVARTGEGPVATPGFVRDQLRAANEHFGPSGIGFRLGGVELVGEDAAHVATRRERDELGRDRYRPGVIDVHVTGRLDDVDAPGEIRGVHWRDRKDADRHWIVLSTAAPPMVLAHELGHLFGLGHGDHPASIMNKTPRDEPPPGERSFVPAERERIERRAAELQRSGRLDDAGSEGGFGR